MFLIYNQVSGMAHSILDCFCFKIFVFLYTLHILCECNVLSKLVKIKRFIILCVGVYALKIKYMNGNNLPIRSAYLRSIEFIIPILERLCLPIPAILGSNADSTSIYFAFYYYIKIRMPQYTGIA